jgi:hypothetical protein
MKKIEKEKEWVKGSKKERDKKAEERKENEKEQWKRGKMGKKGQIYKGKHIWLPLSP